MRFKYTGLRNFVASLENSSLSIHVTGTGVILGLLAAPSSTSRHTLAEFADKVLVLLDVVRLEADAEQVVPEFTLVTLHPVHL